MNISKRTYRMVFSALVAAIYVALTFTQETIFPGSASMAVQFRVSEALTMLCVFTPAAIPGVTVGCLIANTLTLGALPIDMIFGTLATLLSSALIYKFRAVTVKGMPVVSALMPALFNGVIIGLEIEVFFIEGSFNFLSFLTQGSLVAIGEAAVCLTLGLLLVKTIKNKKLEKNLLGI